MIKIGRINLLTPQLVLDVKKNEIKDGDVVSLKYDSDYLSNTSLTLQAGI
jgi:hypothetical protein